MAQISLKILLIASISSFVFFFNSDNSKSCGPYYDYDFDGSFKIFEEKLFDIKGLEPFYLNEYVFNNVDENASIGPRLDNLKEWLEYFDNKPTIDDLEKYIYDTKENDLLNFQKQLEVSDKWKNNSVLHCVDKEKLKKSIEYLLFAKQVEPHVAFSNGWEEPKRDIVAMNLLLNTAIEKFEKTKIKFFKERLAYQAIRLAHYSKQYKRSIELFEKYFTKSNLKSLMSQWSFGHYAGAIKSLGNIAKSNVLFARLFDLCPSRSRQSLISFKFDWQDSLLTEALKECENNHDRVLVYALNAYKNQYFGADAIENIYKYEPDSPYLLLILSRAISMLEKETLPEKTPWYGYKGYINPDYNYGYYRSDSSLYKIVSKIADENKTQKNYLWNFAAGYVSTLQGYTQGVDKYFFEAKRLCPKNNMDFIKRVQIAEVICKINALKNIDEKAEIWIVKDVKWLKENNSIKKLRAEDAFLYIINTLAKQYWIQGDTLKSHLCFGISGKNKPWEDFFTSDSPFRYELALDYHKQPIEMIYMALKDYEPWYREETSEWMKFLIENYYYTLKELDLILAKKYIAKGLFEKATEKLKSQINNETRYRPNIDETQQFLANPFIIHIKDCHDCDFMQRQDTVYTLLSFSKKMIELKYLAETTADKEKSANYYYLLANGYYNITYYGNSWMVSCFNTRGELNHFYTEDENYDLYDCSRAEENYLKAAQKTSNDEFAAKCYFMSAKCEQNKFYNNERSISEYSTKEDYDRLLKIKFENYKTYFKKLTNNYSDTDFFKEALKECKYFNYFVTNYTH
jgi:hypothetical protein